MRESIAIAVVADDERPYHFAGPWLCPAEPRPVASKKWHRVVAEMFCCGSDLSSGFANIFAVTCVALAAQETVFCSLLFASV